MKRPREPAVHPEDASLFRASMIDVKPLAHSTRVEHDRPLPQPIAARRLREDHATLAESLSDQFPWNAGLETGEELA